MDFKALAEQFFSWASRQDIPARNRNILYDYVKMFKKFSYEKVNGQVGNLGGEGGGSNAIPGKSETFVDKMLNGNDGNVEDLTNGVFNGEEYIEKKEETVAEAMKNDSVNVSRSKNCTKKPGAKKIKEKKVRKRKYDGFPEDTTATAAQSNSHKEVNDREKSAKIKRRKSDENKEAKEDFENVQKVKSGDGEKRKKKARKNKSVSIANGNHEENEMVRQIVNNSKESQVVEEDSDNLDGSYLSTLTSEKRRFRSYRVAEVENRDVKKVKVKHCKEEVKEKDIVSVKNAMLFDAVGNKTNRSDTFDSPTVKEASERTSDSKLDPGLAYKAKNKHQSADINAIPSTPPLTTFRRHSITKANVNTEPKEKKRQHMVSTTTMVA